MDTESDLMQRFKDQDGNLIIDLGDHLRELESKYSRLESKYRKIRERPLVVGPAGLVGPAGPRGFPGIMLLCALSHLENKLFCFL